jgi:hypothetical protein
MWFYVAVFAAMFFMWQWHFTLEARAVLRALPRRFGWFFQFLTVCVLTMITGYYGFVSFFDLARETRGRWLPAIGGSVLALSTTVTILYYGMQALGQTVISPRIRALYPAWYSEGTHLLTVVVMWLDFFVNKNMVFNERTFIMFYIFVTFFGLWLLFINYCTGKFPYGFLNGKHSLLKFSALLLAVYAITLAVIVLGNVVRQHTHSRHHIMHSARGKPNP